MKIVRNLSVIVWLLAMTTFISRAQNPAREAGYLYLSPVPNAPYVSAQTRYILARFEEVSPADITNLTSTFIQVRGASSGTHSGRTHVATDGRTVIFTMTNDFSSNEIVTVTLNPGLDPLTAGNLRAYQYRFAVTTAMPGTVAKAATVSDPLAAPAVAFAEDPPAGSDPAEESHPTGESSLVAPVIKPNGVSVPSDFPAMVITVNRNPSPGYLFVENGRNVTPWYAMMLDNNGSPVWYRKGYIQDFKIQKNGLITWISNTTSSASASIPMSFDQNFDNQRIYGTTNGYTYDGHEFTLRDDGGHLVLGYRNNTVNLGLWYPGGNTSNVKEGVIQEFTAAGELIFQWRAWDNFAKNIKTSGTDFPHMNALCYDEDGNILLSSRHLGEVTKINRDTGEIMWRLSGPNSSFTFVNDTFNGTSAQHNISALGDSHYLVFDNGNAHIPRVSRAVEYALDLTNMTATAVWEFRDAPDKFADRFGGVQRLPNGNTLITFARANYPKAIEVNPAGAKTYEMSCSPNGEAYRGFRFPWNGVVSVPYLIAEARPDNVTLIYNKFGDTNVAFYRIYGGTSPAPTTLLGTSTTTLEHLTNVVNGVRNYFRVTAVDDKGQESGYSNEDSLLVNITFPGQNIVSNGDFASGTLPWALVVTAPASASLSGLGGIGHVSVTAGGRYLTDVQLKQAGINLIQGKEYVLEFDAWSMVPRTIQVRVEQNIVGGADYSGIPPIALTPLTNHFEFHFQKSSPTDNNCRLVVNAGAIPSNVYLDNLSLRERVYAPGDFNQNGCVGFEDLEVFASQWLMSESVSSDLNKDNTVDFADFLRFSADWSGDGLCP